MKYILLLGILFAASATFAQAPRIDSMSVDEANSQLIIHGDFDWYQGKVYVDSVEMSILSWSDSLIVTHLPSGGRGYAGPVVVGSRGYRSEPRMVTAWTMHARSALFHSGNTWSQLAQSTWAFSWRADIESWLRLQTSFLAPQNTRSNSSETFAYHYEWYNPGNPNETRREDTVQTGSGPTLGTYDPKLIKFTFSVKGFVNHPFAPSGWTMPVELDTLFLPKSGGVGDIVWADGLRGPSTVVFPPSTSLLILRKSPILVYPRTDTVVVSLDATHLFWDSSGVFSKYQLQIARDTLFARSVVDTTLLTNHQTFVTPTDSSQFYWRVAGITADGISRWSESRHFSSAPVSSALPNATGSFPALTCSPNPANSELKFSLPSELRGWLVLYDLRGRLLRKKSISNIESMRWDVSQIPSGAYIVGLVTNGKLESQTVQIVH